MSAALGALYLLELSLVSAVLGLSASLYVKDHESIRVWSDGVEHTLPTTHYTMVPL